jgi:hypothetical protein
MEAVAVAVNPLAPPPMTKYPFDAKAEGVPMRIFHYRHSSGITNFGDELGPWLADIFLPPQGSVLRPDLQLLLVGTLLNANSIQPGPKIIFGAGSGYGAPAIPNEDWDVRFVRGPLTARALRLPEEKAVTDPAALVAMLLKRPPTPSFPVSYMPHFSQLSPALEKACDSLGINLIDPRWKVERVLNDIRDSGKVLSQALHGVVVADALRVPWVAVDPGSDHWFKWRDWAAGMELPIIIPTHAGFLSGVSTAGLQRALDAAPSLSNPKILRQRLNRLIGELQQLRTEIRERRGPFAPEKDASPSAAIPVQRGN